MPLKLALNTKAYLLTLTFTLLAAAVQTAKPQASIWINIIEILGWSILGVSGFIGLNRSEATSSFFVLSDRVDQADVAAERLGETARNAQSPPVRNEAMLRVVDERQKGDVAHRDRNTLNDVSMNSYKWQKHLLFGGIVVIALARAAALFIRG